MTREELLKQAKPILFNTEMVQAILEGRKTVTRRVIKLPNHVKQNENGLYTLFVEGTCYENQSMEQIKEYIKPPFKGGDYLYVRETWCNWADDIGNNFFYKATDDGVDGFSPKWKPSIHMPKEAARIFLKVTDVRVERLQDITEEQAKAEGVSRLFDYMSDKDFEDWMRSLGQSEKQKSDWDYKNYLWHGDYGTTGQGNKKTDNWEYQYSAYDSVVDSFSSLWNTTVPLKEWDTYGWEANPWVWVIEFERVEV